MLGLYHLPPHPVVHLLREGGIHRVALHDKGPALMELDRVHLCESLPQACIVPIPWGRCWHAVPGAHPKPTRPSRSGLQDIQACQNVRCPRLKDASGASHVGSLCQPQWHRGDCRGPEVQPHLSFPMKSSPPLDKLVGSLEMR